MKKLLLAPTTAFAILIGFGTITACANPTPVANAEASAQQALAEQPARVVISVRNERHVMAALKAVEGLRALDPPVEEIRILVFGEALYAIQKDGPWDEALNTAIREGVQVEACELAMNRLEVSPDTFVEGVSTVPHVFVESIRLQQEGWYSIEY